MDCVIYAIANNSFFYFQMGMASIYKRRCIMPGLNRRGPEEQGPMTGKGRGFCAIPVNQRQGNIGGGRGVFEQAAERRCRNQYFLTGMPGWMKFQKGMNSSGSIAQTLSQKNEITVLKNRAEFLSHELEEIQTKIKTMEEMKS